MSNGGSAMWAYRVETTLTQSGTLTPRDLPFHTGEEVEVIVLPRASASPGENRYPLHGTPIRYDDPFGPAAGDDWNAAR